MIIRLKYILMLASLFLCCSCGGKKPTHIVSAQQYIENVSAKTGFAQDKIIVLSEEGFERLADDIVDKKLYTFYGVVYKSQVISAGELDIKSCWGQFRDLYKQIPIRGNNTAQDLSGISYLGNIRFDPAKKTAVLLFSNNHARSLLRNVRPVMDALKDDPEFDYIVISLDHPKFLKI